MRQKLRGVAALFVLGFLCGAQGALADEMVYQPVNPNFGGSPFNGAFLLNQALAQNDHKESSTPIPSSLSNSLEAQLERALINRLSRDLIDNAFGDLDEPLENFTVTIGSSQFSVNTDDPAFTVVTIINLDTGESSVITIPNF